MEYILHILIFTCFYILLSQSLNIAAGYTGLISLAHAGFYGIGAYTTAILSTKWGLSFWLNLPLAMLVSGAIALLISLIILRTVEDYFIICTLGIQVVIFSIMNNWTGMTNGPLGIPGIPGIRFLGMALDTRIKFLALLLFFVLVVWGILKNVSRSGFGNTLKAIGEDEIYVQSIGKNVRQYRVISFTIGAILAAIPGGLYAHYVSYIDPASFTVSESVFILSIVIIGGLESLAGSCLSSVFLVMLPEGLRFLGMSNNTAAGVRQIIYGAILVLIMLKGNKRIKG